MEKYIELVIGIAGIILAFIPENNYWKAIAILVTALIIAIISIYKAENENKKLKEGKYKEIDSNLLKKIKTMLYESKSIDYIRFFDFGGHFYKYDIKPLRMYYEACLNNNPEFYFSDSDLNGLKEELDYNVIQLFRILDSNTFSLEVDPDLMAVPREWREERPEHFKKVVNQANHHATEIVEIYSKLVQVARKKMIDL